MQYTIHDARQYLFGAVNPERLVARSAEAAITATLADQSIDAVLTTGKEALADVIRQELQRQLAIYELGVEVRSVSLTDLAPPPQVSDAFTRAASARSDRERLILEARTYASERLAQARSESQQATDKARADHDRAIDLARSEADRFNALVYEYHKAPALTTARLYLETVAQILPRFRSNIIVDSGKGVDIMIMRKEQGGTER